MSPYNTLNEICNSIDVESRPEYVKYEKDIVVLFKDGDILQQDEDLSVTNTDGIMYYWCGLYHINKTKQSNIALDYFKLASEAGLYESYNNIGEIYDVYFNDYEKAKAYYHKALDASLYNPKYIYNLANIYDAIDEEYDTAKIYYKQALDLGNWYAAACLANIYDQYNDDIDEAVKYYLIAINHGDDESFIHLINLISDMYINYNEIISISEDDINNIIHHAKTHPKQMRELHNDHHIISNDLPPKLSCAWSEILIELGLEKPDITALNYFALKRKNQSKLAVCDICMSDGELECIPINWCLHYVCIECYKMVWDKSCPFCRLD